LVGLALSVVELWLNIVIDLLVDIVVTPFLLRGSRVHINL